MSQASLISIGTELLIGQTIDTNSAWIGQELNRIGVWIANKITIGDKEQDICKAIDFARSQSKIVIITGGLGPTSDDITKDVLFRYTGETSLVLDQDSLHRIETFLAERGRTMHEVHAKQAMLPKSSEPIPNLVGTAPGMWFRFDDYQMIVTPGVPSEMKHMFTQYILPQLATEQAFQVIHKTVITYGRGESDVAASLSDFEKRLPQGVSIAYLPHQQLLRIRLTSYHATSHSEEMSAIMQGLYTEIQEILADIIIANEDISVAEMIGKALVQSGKSISTAESCTGGFLAHQITSIAGSSAYYKGSVVAYDNAIKKKFLQVTEQTLSQHGAVSEPVVQQMAKQVRQDFDTDYAIALSGIMGPGGEGGTKRVGTVCIAIADRNTEVVTTKYLRYDRIKNIQEAAMASMILLLQYSRNKV